MVQLPGTSRGPKLSWEGGVASHWARGKHPPGGGGGPGRTIVKEARGVGGRQQIRPRQWHVPRPGCLSLGLSQVPGPATFCPSATSQRSLRSTGGHTAAPPLRAQIWCSARPGSPASATLPYLDPARGSPEPAGPCAHRVPQTSSPVLQRPASGRLSGISKSAFSTQPFPIRLRPSPLSPTSSFLCLNLTPVAPKTGFAPKLLHRI